MYLLPYLILLLLAALSISLAYSFFQKRDPAPVKRSVLKDDEFIHMTQLTVDKLKKIKKNRLDKLMDETLEDEYVC